MAWKTLLKLLGRHAVPKEGGRFRAGLTRREVCRASAGLAAAAVLLPVAQGCAAQDDGDGTTDGTEGAVMAGAQHVTGGTTFGELVANPAFGEGGYALLPWFGTREDMATTVADAGDYMPYHTYFDTQTMVDPLNRLVDDAAAGRQVFYRVYSDDEVAEDPAKADVGLFFFRGRANAPFAVVCPGGGFSYVGSLHESLPHALALSRLGYNAFSLSYRMGSGDLAVQDLAAAVSLVFNRAGELGVDTQDYSLWGSSAGARMASAVGTYGAAVFGGDDVPRPATVVMAYTGQSTYTEQDPPTYSVVGSRDGIASPRTMQARIAALQEAGVPAEIQVFDGLSHGFGVGTGTVAEGWVDDAAAFWDANSAVHLSDLDDGAAAQTENGRTVINLWTAGNVPTQTQVTSWSDAYNDPQDFMPNMVFVPAVEGVAVKGAVLICAGGAFMYRSDEPEGFDVADELAARGYQCFVVRYRVRPYTMEEGSLDLGRAMRYVRAHAGDYGVDPANIAIMGFSAGGILCGDVMLHFRGDANGTALDPSYVPDELDETPVDAAAVGMVYAFYGRLSVASTDVDEFRAADLPPTYFTYGTEDPFYRQFGACIEALREAGVTVEDHPLEGLPHGFGARGGWIDDYDRFLTEVFAG